METTSTTDDYDGYAIYPDDAGPCLQDETYGFAQKYIPIVYSLVFVLAVVGNVLVLCVIRQYKNRNSGACAYSLTDTFLLHLAISDLMLAFTLPLFVVQNTHEWVFGITLCKVTGALFSMSRYSGILFLACISFDRYLAIVHAVTSGWKRNTCHAQFACAVIWLVCLGLSGVDIAFGHAGEEDILNKTVTVCRVWFTQNPTGWQVGLHLVSLILGFCLPLLIMLYCYIQIFRSLCNAPRRQKRRSLRLILSLVSAFVIFWAPYNGFQLVDSLEKLQVLTGSCSFFHILDVGIVITESIGLFHCALNPLLYGFIGEKFRRELVKMCKHPLVQRGWLEVHEWKGKRLRKSTVSFSSAESENTSYSVMG